MRVAVVLVALAAAAPAFAQGNVQDRDAILKAREAVWRAWFAGDIPTLKRLVPADTIVISGGEEAFKHQAEILQSATEFHASGGRLVSLEFPRTEVQRFGDVAGDMEHFSAGNGCEGEAVCERGAGDGDLCAAGWGVGESGMAYRFGEISEECH
jgi:hypothetical protein